MALAAVRDLRDFRAPASTEQLEAFETDVLSGFVLARASAGLAAGTVRGDVGNLEQIRTRFGRRWVLLHLIEETARHGGHADIIRESLDGATLYPLMAAAEPWPDPWFEPWEPAAPAG